MACYEMSHEVNKPVKCDSSWCCEEDWWTAESKMVHKGGMCSAPANAYHEDGGFECPMPVPEYTEVVFV